KTVPLRGTFGGQVGGNGTVEIPHRGSVNITFAGELDRIIGTIHDEKSGANSVFEADRNVYDKSTNQAPQAGDYTVLMQPAASTLGQANIPQGVGHGSVTVKTNGTV